MPDSAEPIAPMGHNLPPPDPFEAIQVHICDLFDEAKNWADGEPITTQKQADDVSALIRMVQEAERTADEERKRENEPHDLGKATVQAKYAPLIADTKKERGKTVLAIAALKSVLAPWLKKLDDEQQARARAAREEADRAAQAAAEAMRQAAETDLDAREQAEALVTQARRAESASKASENARPQATGYGRATTLRDNWQPSLADAKAAASHYWKRDPSTFDGFLLSLAKADVLAGHRTIPGFNITNDRTVV